jgi:hypothetical protein
MTQTLRAESDHHLIDGFEGPIGFGYAVSFSFSDQAMNSSLSSDGSCGFTGGRVQSAPIAFASACLCSRALTFCPAWSSSLIQS